MGDATGCSLKLDAVKELALEAAAAIAAAWFFFVAASLLDAERGLVYPVSLATASKSICRILRRCNSGGKSYDCRFVDVRGRGGQNGHTFPEKFIKQLSRNL